MDENLREVEFHEFCPKCENKETKEVDEPCDSCLSEPVNESRKPVNFKEKEWYLWIVKNALIADLVVMMDHAEKD